MATPRIPRMSETMLTDLRSVARCLLQSKWEVHNDKYKKFIGDMGTISVVPGRPQEWYPLIKKEMKRVWFCSEHGVDWWFKPTRGISKRTGMVYHGVEVTVTREMFNCLDAHAPQRVKRVPHVQQNKISDSFLHFLSTVGT